MIILSQILSQSVNVYKRKTLLIKLPQSRLIEIDGIHAKKSSSSPKNDFVQLFVLFMICMLHCENIQIFNLTIKQKPMFLICRHVTIKKKLN